MKKNTGPAKPREIQLVKDIFQCLQENINADAQTIAAHFNIAPNFFHDRYTTVSGETLEDTRTKIIFLRAIDAAIKENKTIKQVSDELVYSSVHSFSRAFKKYFKIPPGQYMKNKKR